MGVKKIGIMIASLTLVLVAFYYFYNTRELYGNDEASIIKVIKSFDSYSNKGIEILEIKDFGNVRIVGFLSDNSPSYIEFNKNQKGNYKWSHIQPQDNVSFNMFVPFGERKMMFVTNYENEIAKMQVDINGTTIEQSFNPYHATVTWVDFPQKNKDSYELRNWKYYDESGNLINENELFN